jgi:DNA-binding response OmpR family regulator
MSPDARIAADHESPVLLVEDDDSLRRILAVQLRAKGWRVVEARTAEEAVERLSGGCRPGLVLLDVNLPGDTGWDVLRDPVFAAAGAPPVVIASAVTVSPRRLAEFHVGGYLPKPFPIETLLETVGRTYVRRDNPQP